MGSCTDRNHSSQKRGPALARKDRSYQIDSTPPETELQKTASKAKKVLKHQENTTHSRDFELKPRGSKGAPGVAKVRKVAEQQIPERFE